MQATRSDTVETWFSVISPNIYSFPLLTRTRIKHCNTLQARLLQESGTASAQVELFSESHVPSVPSQRGQNNRNNVDICVGFRGRWCHAQTLPAPGPEEPARAPTQRQQPSSHMKSPRPRSVTRLGGAVWAPGADREGHAGHAGHAEARDGQRRRNPDLRW